MVRPVHKILGSLVLGLLLLPSFSLSLQGSSLETIQGQIAKYLRRPGLRSADWGIEVVDPTDDKVLIALNPDKTFTPASVVKVVTTAAALEKLGPDFKFRTGVYTNGNLMPDGTLTGDLILVGRSDPNLVDTNGDLLEKPVLVELREKLQSMGVKKIKGDLVGDDSYYEFSLHGKGLTAEDFKFRYAAPISALSINDNVVWVHARPTTYNKRVIVSLEPRSSYFHIRNLGITGSSRSKRTLYVRLIPGTRTVVVSGILPISRGGYARSILMEKPAELVANVFKEELEQNDITVEGEVQVIHRGDLPGAAKRSWKLLAEHESAPLIRALEIINKRSNNLHAEMLLRTLGAELRGAGTDEAGLQVVKEFLVDSGIESSKISLSDGSGLSRDNLITPRFQTSLLLFLSTRPYFELFLNTLAVSGTDGTLKNRLASQPLRGVIHAKTGTMYKVISLSGYMTTKSGRNLVFSIFANNFRASATRVRKTIDEICALFVNFY